MQTDYGALMRGLPMDFPSDLEARNIGEQYMFGPSILVSPIYEFRARTRDIYLPKGHRWYDFHSGKRHEGGRWIEADAPLSDMPLFVRAGAILPLGPDVQFHDEDPAGEVTVMVYPGEDGSFSLYEDDGETYDYVQGAWSRIALTWDETLQTLTIGTIEGAYRVAEARSFLVKWADTPGQSIRVRYSGTELAIKRP